MNADARADMRDCRAWNQAGTTLADPRGVIMKRHASGKSSWGGSRRGADPTAARPMALARLRAAPGRGDAFARLVAGRMGEGEPGPLVSRVFRAGGDPDLFLVRTARADGGALGPEPWAPWLDAVLRDAVARDLVPAPIARPPEADLFLPIERRGAPPLAPARGP
jgi:hypothetical protein